MTIFSFFAVKLSFNLLQKRRLESLLHDFTTGNPIEKGAKLNLIIALTRLLATDKTYLRTLL